MDPLAEMRDQQRLFRQRFGRDSWLLGSSPFLRDLFAFLERVADSTLPVLLLGPRGCGRSDAARWLHLLGARREAPFVQLDVSAIEGDDLTSELTASLVRALEGTVFLAAVDEAKRSVQSQLADLLNRRLPHVVPEAGGPPALVPRIVASARPSPAPALHPSLHSELAFLSFEMQGLAARPEDIDALTCYFLRAYRGSELTLCGKAGAALRAYPWPGNIVELRQTVARVASFCAGGRFDVENLRAHAPQTLSGSAAPAPVELNELVGACLRGEPDAKEVANPLHPALRRVLVHLSRHLGEPLTLADLAQAAFVSPSHLCHLSKDQLGISPMALLIRVRVAHAKQLLRTEPALRIVDVSGRSGFGDLRHFERTFKRLVGMTPRDFRKRERWHCPRSAGSPRSAVAR